MLPTKLKWPLNTLLYAALVGVILLGFSLYRAQLKLDLNTDACQTLSELLSQQKFNLNARVDADVASIKNLSEIVRFLPNEAAEVARLGDEFVSNTNFDYMIISSTDGRGISTGGQSVYVADRPYFDDALAGKTVLGAPIFSSISSNVVVPMATPIRANGEIVGVLSAAYNISALRNLILPSYKGAANSYITDSSGTVLYSSIQSSTKLEPKNFFDMLSSGTFLEHDDVDMITQKLGEGRPGHARFMFADGELLLHYEPLAINDWYIFMIVPQAVISAQANSISQSAAVLAGSALVLFTVLTAYTLRLQRKSSNEKAARLHDLEFAAYYDPLTKLPNLNKFKLDAGVLLRNNPDKHFLILKFDILNFKLINEIFGFPCGNKVICTLADFVTNTREAMQLGGCFARINADEFVFLEELTPVVAGINATPGLMTGLFAEAVEPLLGSHRIELRYGRYLLEPAECDIAAIIEKVNFAHRIAKKQKSSLVCDYSDDFRQKILRETQIENTMEAALENDEFVVYLQPKHDLNTEDVVGAEALVRWVHSDKNIVSPGDFIPLFERNGFIIQLDLYVFEQVCALLRAWLDEGLPLVTISVNFSKLHLDNDRLADDLADIAQKYHVPKNYIEIELTESIIFNNEDILEGLLHRLHELGFTLSMDDFGSGYSSLGLLKNLPVDVIKIDKMFFGDSMYKARAKTVIESVMQMAKKLGIHTVAEGVELQEHIDFLRSVGCNTVQGFYYARPMPAPEFLTHCCASLEGARLQSEQKTLDLDSLRAWSLACSMPDHEVPLATYRLFQFSLRETLTMEYGVDEMLELLRICGNMVGRVFAHDALALSLPFEAFFQSMQQVFARDKLGLLALERYDPENGRMVLTVHDDLDCFGLPDLGTTFCQYDEGLISGILHAYTGADYSVIETDCWATGAGLCRFVVTRR